MSIDIKLVILCGGSGTRLWPLSRQSLPKQFVPMINGQSLLELTLRRVKDLTIHKSIQVLANSDHRFLVEDHAKFAGVEVEMVLEPTPRNTAPAILASALLADGDDLMLFMPADHYIPDEDLFLKTVVAGTESAKSGSIVTFGIKPTSPHTGYGYIEIENQSEVVKDVLRFVEKPSIKSAEEFLVSGQHFWNAGIFLAKASTIIEAMKVFADDIFDSVSRSVELANHSDNKVHLDRKTFENSRSESIDYALLEKFDSIQMVPFEGIWSDVGGWNALAGLDNGKSKNALYYESKNTFIQPDKRPVIALGLEDIIIADTSDAVLVASKSHSERVKEVVADLISQGMSVATDHRHAFRPWGCYDSIEEGKGYKVKNITVNPGQRLSLQRHQHRSEHWVVVEGVAEVVCGNETMILQANESIYIPKGTIHRLSNPGKTNLKIIEIQTGDYLEEDDIERIEDEYDR